MSRIVWSGGNNYKLSACMPRLLQEESRLWDYEIEAELGRGSSGHVYRVKSRKSGQLYALKKINMASCHEKERIQIYREIKALKLIDHPNIVPYYESFLSKEHVYIVMQYVSGGDLAQVLSDRKSRGRGFTEDEIWKIAQGALEGIKHLHENHIVHRDIKLQNIFLDSKGCVKIGDLGLCKSIHGPRESISTRVGTPIYFAPELVRSQCYCYPVDVWALGCVLYTLMAQQHPFQQATIQTLALFVLQTQVKPLKGYSYPLIEFTLSMLVKDSKDRPLSHALAITARNRGKKPIADRISVLNFQKLTFLYEGVKNDAKMRAKFGIIPSNKDIVSSRNNMVSSRNDIVPSMSDDTNNVIGSANANINSNIINNSNSHYKSNTPSPLSSTKPIYLPSNKSTSINKMDKLNNNNNSNPQQNRQLLQKQGSIFNRSSIQFRPIVHNHRNSQSFQKGTNLVNTNQIIRPQKSMSMSFYTPNKNIAQNSNHNNNNKWGHINYSPIKSNGFTNSITSANIQGLLNSNHGYYRRINQKRV